MTALASDVREMFHEQVEYRELLMQMTKRDLLLRYKQTMMGFGWAVFMPLVNTAVFSVIFTRVAPIDTGVPYPLFAFCGLLRLELLRLVAALRGELADQQHEPGDEGLLPARDLSLLRRCSSALVDFAVAIHRAGRADGLLPRRARRPTIVLLPVVLVVHDRLHRGAVAAAGDGQPVLPRRQVPVRGGHHGVDVRDVGALPGAACVGGRIGATARR